MIFFLSFLPPQFVLLYLHVIHIQYNTWVTVYANSVFVEAAGQSPELKTTIFIHSPTNLPKSWLGGEEFSLCWFKSLISLQWLSIWGPIVGVSFCDVYTCPPGSQLETLLENLICVATVHYLLLEHAFSVRWYPVKETRLFCFSLVMWD